MPNPISSAVQEMVTSSLTSKFLGGNKKSEDAHQQQNKTSSSSAGLLGKISSTIASAVNSTNQQQVPDQQQQQMSGGRYNQSYYVGGGYPQQQQQGTPGYPPSPSAGGYPQQQQHGTPGYPPSPSAGGYPQQQQHGPPGYPPSPSAGGYPQQQQHGPPGYPPSPSAGGYPQQQQHGPPGYPPSPSAGGYPQHQQHGPPGYPPSPSAGGYPPQPQHQQPQYGHGGTPPYGTLGAYPPQQQQQAPYPTTGPIGFNVDVIPTTGGGYPPYQPNLGGFSGGPSPAPYPQQQQHHQQYQQAPYPASGGGGGYSPQQQTSYGGAVEGHGHGGGYPQMQQQQQQHTHNYPQMQQQTHSRARKTSGGSPTMATPSIRPNPNFNAQVTAELLRKAMKGLGCDKGKVIQALVNCSNSQRQEVIRAFKQMYGKDLIQDLRSELSGDFEDLILALMEHPAVCDAAQLRRAMQGLGTKEHVLIEIMTTRTNAQIRAIKMAYRQMFHTDLEHDIVGDTSGYFRRLLISLCSGARDENMHTDPARASQDAQRLWRAGEARLGTDEIAFNSVLAAQNFAQLRLVFEEYQRQHGHSIEQAIANEFSGDIRDANLALVKSIRSRSAYFAELLYKSMKGLGTRDTDLIRVVVTRSEIDLADIRQAYQKMYGTSLEKAITSDCSGAYKDGLIAIEITHSFAYNPTTSGLVA
uniref:Annexin n=1 Tax=Globodera rostochiensis TaxID=31243 RepID=A0A914I0P8_GLORO